MKPKLCIVILLAGITLLTHPLLLPTQANPISSKNGVKRTMNDSEKRIIADINKVISLLALKSTTADSIACEFGSPVKTGVYSEVKPFNSDLARFSVDNYPNIFMTIKEDSPIHIEAFQENLGKYTSGVSDFKQPASITFQTKPLGNDLFYYQTIVTYIGPFLGRNLDESKVLWISIRKEPKEFYREDN